MCLSPWGAHGSFHGNTISDGSHRPATVVDAPAGSKLGSDLEMARERLSIQYSLSFYPWILLVSLVHSFNFSVPPWHLIFSPSMRVYFVSLSFSLSLFLSLLSSPRCLPPPPPPHAWFSLPVALQRKFNIGLFGVSKDSIRRSSGHYTKTNISCCGQEQQTLPHYHAHFCSTGLVSCSLLSDSFSLLNLLLRTSLHLSKSESVERVFTFCKHFRESCYGVIWNFWHSKYSMGTLLSLCSRCSSLFLSRKKCRAWNIDRYRQIDRSTDR